MSGKCISANHGDGESFFMFNLVFNNPLLKLQLGLGLEKILCPAGFLATNAAENCLKFSLKIPVCFFLTPLLSPHP